MEHYLSYDKTKEKTTIKSSTIMSNLTTLFAGVKLKNPVIAASSGFTANVELCKQLEEAGIAAIVLKSVFEEQIEEQTKSMLSDEQLGEAADMLAGYVKGNVLNTYISHIRAVKKAVKIPVIASICCSQLGEWSSFAKVIEESGADAIELNIMSVCTEKDYRYGAYEDKQSEIFSQVKNVVSIPVIVKLADSLTNPVAAVNSLYAHGAKSVVLFNRHYQTDIDVESMRIVAGEICSNPNEICERLRWTAICSAKIPHLRYAISGGVHSGEDVIKAILSGASAVEICSVLYKKGPKAVKEIIADMEDWMTRKKFNTIDEFRGRLNAKGITDETAYERTQFVAFTHSKHYEIEK